MSKAKKQYVGKIGFCQNNVLGFTDKYGNPLKGGHYVYIREIHGNKCNVNIVTSLEDKNEQLFCDKINKVKKGYLYPIPKHDANFSRWSAINLDGNIQNVSLTAIKNIGIVSMKKRHRFFVGKYTKIPRKR